MTKYSGIMREANSDSQVIMVYRDYYHPMNTIYRTNISRSLIITVLCPSFALKLTQMRLRHYHIIYSL